MKKTPGHIIILHMCTINDNHIMYGSWDIEHNIQIFCHFGPYFALLPPITTKKSKFWKTEKKTTGDIIILHKCIKNHNHMLYCSLDMACNGCNCYFSFWVIFCPFTSLTAWKIKNLKKWKNSWRYHHFTIVYQKSWSYICYTIPEI